MLQCLFALALVLDSSKDLSVKALNQKSLERSISKMRSLRVIGDPEALVCAIPLKQLHAQKLRKMDPMTRPAGPAVLDPMIHPTPVRACPQP